jgi:hypothetical protein
MKKSMFLILVLALSVPVFAADEMKKLDWMVGDWTGEASMQMGAEKTKTQMQESIQWKLGGKAILIQGLGKDDKGATVHESLAVISYNDAAKKYEFEAWTARYPHADTWFEVGEGTATWGLDTPQGGKVRYTISRTEKGHWHEIGEFSRDGNQWMKFFDMTLQKK